MAFDTTQWFLTQNHLFNFYANSIIAAHFRGLHESISPLLNIGINDEYPKR